ncbi:MAG TPA: HAD family hydrolase [Bosea sp. (in: a-proteobacteria)]|jgi:HAD superfamily hydrolase (TIGR01509 family)|uniref:HAD family hydrolase n=1 Tax=Bosea sp. (in: a-proteobacteria) TaxID=1871050 RepID=UPI002E10B65D|nr:HAD family hydrolase [Bosea sp. (in: a-proteobacteria)]
MPDLVIYDCDGTLIDTETLYGEVSLAACHALGLTEWTLDHYVDSIVGIPWSDGVKIIEAAHGRTLPPDFEQGIEDAVALRLEAELRALPGVREALDAIGGRRCVASSTSLAPLRRNLTITGLIDLFDPHVFSASQVARGKPHPDVFLHAAAEMGARPQNCLVIEDSVPGVLAARSAGMRVVGFTGVSHDRQRSAARLTQAGALAVIDDFAQWPGLVKELRASD